MLKFNTARRETNTINYFITSEYIYEYVSGPSQAYIVFSFTTMIFLYVYVTYIYIKGRYAASTRQP